MGMEKFSAINENARYDFEILIYSEVQKEE
jgi:hypothetical protein